MPLVLGAFRAAAAMAAQKLSAFDYAQFIVRLKIFSAIGVYNEQVERARKLAAIDAQGREDQRRIAEEGKFNWLDAADVGRDGFVNFGGGAINGASGLVNGITGAANWANNTCASVNLCVDIPDITAIPAVPIWGDYDLYRWSSYAGSATLQAVAVVGSGGIGAGGLSADAGTALLNASGINLARAGVSKISGLLNLGETGTEAATTATSSLAADAAAADRAAQAATESASAGGSNFMAQGEAFAENAANAKPMPGYHDVVVHGSATDFGATADAWANGTNFSHRVLADLIERDPAYGGGPIRLLSCNTGGCGATAAQNLANSLGVEVYAPTNTLWAYQSGGLVVGPAPTVPTGGWVSKFPWGTP